MTQKTIGPTFADELKAYGIANSIVIIGTHFTWFADGTIEFFDDTPSNVETAVNAVYAAHDPTATLSIPDPLGFAIACKTAAGGIVAANALAVAYPLFFDAVSTQMWADVQALIIDAHNHTVLSDAAYAAFKTAAAAHDIPITLP